MEDNIKGKAFPLLLVLTIICLVATASSWLNLQKFKSLKTQEVEKRLDAEEKVSVLQREMILIQEKIKGKETEIEKEKAEHQKSKELLQQEQLANQGLKEDLVRITKVKEALEEELKDTLVAPKPKKTKK